VKHYSLLGLVPLALYLGVFTLVPVISTLILSFRTPESDWGLGAFHALAAYYQFGEAVGNTLAITGLGLVIELSLGLAAADARHGRGTDGSRLDAAGGAAVSGAAMATAPGAVSGVEA
jgi:ABC-type sugar transport system permease subunit